MSRLEEKLEKYLRENQDKVNEKKTESLIDTTELKVTFNKSNGTYFVIVKDQNYVDVDFRK